MHAKPAGGCLGSISQSVHAHNIAAGAWGEDAKLKEFVGSGAYRELFNTEWVTIAYATAGQSLAQGQARRRSMCEWTIELLRELGKERWAANFRFTSVPYDSLYELPLFVGPMWHRPDRAEPVGLLAPS